jgi:hypothetical protein
MPIRVRCARRRHGLRRDFHGLLCGPVAAGRVVIIRPAADLGAVGSPFQRPAIAVIGPVVGQAETRLVDRLGDFLENIYHCRRYFWHMLNLQL